MGVEENCVGVALRRGKKRKRVYGWILRRDVDGVTFRADGPECPLVTTAGQAVIFHAWTDGNLKYATKVEPVASVPDSIKAVAQTKIRYNFAQIQLRKFNYSIVPDYIHLVRVDKDGRRFANARLVFRNVDEVFGADERIFVEPAKEGEDLNAFRRRFIDLLYEVLIDGPDSVVQRLLKTIEAKDVLGLKRRQGPGSLSLSAQLDQGQRGCEMLLAPEVAAQLKALYEPVRQEIQKAGKNPRSKLKRAAGSLMLTQHAAMLAHFLDAGEMRTSLGEASCRRIGVLLEAEALARERAKYGQERAEEELAERPLSPRADLVPASPPPTPEPSAASRSFLQQCRRGELSELQEAPQRLFAVKRPRTESPAPKLTSPSPSTSTESPELLLL